MVFAENLYQNIIKIEAEKFSQLKVITGYASANFLLKIKNEFPLLKIKLFIGMASQGISIEDHSAYKLMMSESDFIQVYYQIKGAPTHIKLLNFSSKLAESTYIGSANFSSNGFGEQKELMAKIEFDSSELFEDQNSNSILCTSKEVEKYIKFYKATDTQMFSKEIFSSFEQTPREEDEQEKISNDVELSKELEQVNSSTKKLKTDTYPIKRVKEKKDKSSDENILLIKKWRNISSIREYNSIEVEIVKAKEQDVRWSTSGINGIFGGSEVYLQQGPGKSLSEILPPKGRFSLITDDGISLEAELFGAFSKKIRFIDFDILNYILKRIGILEKRPISITDLDFYGRNTILFEKLDENKYILNFEVS